MVDTSSQTPQTSSISKVLVSLEEDDEFEDFPVEDWNDSEAKIAEGSESLWEEKWDDDDADDEFSAQLREELRKTAGN